MFSVICLRERAYFRTMARRLDLARKPDPRRVPRDVLSDDVEKDLEIARLDLALLSPQRERLREDVAHPQEATSVGGRSRQELFLKTRKVLATNLQPAWSQADPVHGCELCPTSAARPWSATQRRAAPPL